MYNITFVKTYMQIYAKNIRILPFYSYFLFINAWEQRKVDDFSKEKYGGGTPKTIVEEYWNGDIDWIQSSDLTNHKVFDVIARKHVTKEGIKRSATKLVPANSIAIVTRVGFGKLTFMPNEYATSQDFLSLSKLNFESKFSVYSLFNKLQNELNSVQGTSIKGITKEELLNKNILVPIENDEQIKIGSFFKQLDDTITLHQRKLDKLKLLKQGYLQQFFPQYDEKIPKVRFANFTDEWEQRNVGNFLSESKVKGSDGSIAKKITVKLWRKGIVPKNNMFKGSSATQYYIRSAGQFMYGKLDFLNQSFGILPAELNGYESTLDSPAFDFKNGIDPIFFLENVCQENFYKYQGNIANGSRKAKRIHSDTFFDMPIIIPNFEEQQKVGSFFKELDTTIALHQSKLGKLKSLKQVLLQKMFN